MAGEPTLNPGDTGDWVTYLQQLLEFLGVGTGFTAGVFDDVTAAAVRAAQQSNALAVNGVCDEQTWAALTSATQQPAQQGGDAAVPGDIAVSMQDEIAAPGDEIALTELDELPGHVTAVC